MKHVKKWVKWIGIVCLIPVALALLLFILLYIPPFQNFVVKQVTRYASEATGMQIHVGNVRFSFPLNLTVRQAGVLRADGDTLLMLQRLTVGVRPLPLLKKEVVIDAVDVEGVKVNTGDYIEGMELKGVLGKLSANSDGIDLKEQHAVLNKLELSDTALTLLMRADSTTEEDTTSSPVNWKIRLDEVTFDRVCFAMQMPADSLRLSTYIDQARLTDGEADLSAARYAAGRFSIEKSTFNFDTGYLSPEKGFDLSHLALSGLNAAVESIRYQGKEMQADIRSLSVQERSGLTVESLTGRLASDSVDIQATDVRLKTSYSSAELEAHIPWSALAERPEGEMQVKLDARLGKQDVMLAAGALPEDFRQAYPNRPFTLTASADGNLAVLHLRTLKGELPGALTIRASGEMEAVTDSIRRSGEVKLEAETGNLDFVLSLLPEAQRERFRIPAGIRLNGNATVANREYQGELTLTQAGGSLRANGRYDLKKEAYSADLHIDSLRPDHFMPHDSLLGLTASIQAEGQGTDFFAASTWARIDGKIDHIRYGNRSLGNVRLDASLKQHRAQAKLTSDYPLARMNLALDATLQRNDVSGTLTIDAGNIDLYGFHLMKAPFSTSFQLFAEGSSDLKENTKLDITLGNWEIATERQVFHPKTLTLHAFTNPDTTLVSVHAGDLGAVLTGTAGLNELTTKLTQVSDDVALQLKQDSTLNLHALRALLPDLHLEVTAGRDNPVYNYLQTYYVEFSDFSLNAYTSPQTGIRMTAGLYGLARDTFMIDSIRALVWQDTLGLKYRLQVEKEKYRRQAPFSAGVDGSLRYDYADARLYFKNGAGETGFLLGVEAHKIPGGVRLHLFPDDPILAFRSFRMNSDNFVEIKGMKDISANLRLRGDQDASIWIHSEPAGNEGEEVHLELSQIDLAQISNAVSYIPSMGGLLSADLQYVPSDSTFMVAADVRVDSLAYENDRLGDVMVNAVYLPVEKGNHQVDLHLFRNQTEVTAATAVYRTGNPARITGNVDLLHLPLDLVNPFIPEDMANLSGDLDGHLDFDGATAGPRLDGYLQLDSAAVFVGAVGSSFRFDEKRIEITENLLTFDNYDIFASGNNPFVIDGTIDFHDFSRMMADLTLRAQNLELLNVRRNDESLVYGKVYVNLNSTAKGPLNALTMRGNLELLGNTNVTYVLRDSPLSVQDRMSGMVTFVSFADTIRRPAPQKPPLPLGGLDMLVTVSIDEAVQLNVDLTPDHSSYVNLEGGGDLSFQYTPQGDMVLNGRYTMTGGTVKYSIPVVPLKDFTIQNGSYVQWTGNPMNPTLNLTATERVRTSVSINDQSPQLVNFDVGIELKQTLDNLALQFTLNAPENMAVQNQLSEMSAEERSKQAVSMLVTGMYLAGGGGGGGKVNLDMGGALNSLLQSEINNIAGNALKSVDISFGMDTYDENGDEGGGSRTDYNISFAKRFYNDRIRVVVGGRISTGENINNGQAQPFIDNITVEYRLDTSGSRYIKLFHDTNYESLLEGEITETGAGIVLRKKMLHLRELFNFKKKKVKPVKQEEEAK